MRNKEFKPLRSLIQETLNQLNQQYNGVEGINGISSGFNDLDKITKGFQPGSLIIIGGRPGMGKTAFALNIALNAASAKKRIAFFTNEMSSQQITARFLSIAGEIPTSRLMRGCLSEEEWECLAKTANYLEETNIYIDDTPNISPADIYSMCRKLATGIDLLIIDYLQLMESECFNKRYRIADISYRLKCLAKEVNVPVILLSMINKTNNLIKRPQLFDFRAFEPVAHDADLIMLLYRDEYYNQYTQDKGIAEIIVAKNRNGFTGVTFLKFHGEYLKFSNLEEKL
jgi:replicative DNA helicase